MEAFNLIEGEFTSDEALEILMNLINEKIRFHEVQSLTKIEMGISGLEKHKDRIEYLKKTRSRLKEIMEQASKNNCLVALNAEVTIQFGKD
ncbi:MAG: hypothetical protein RIT43_1542 [Bacteroidota bacterium]|jgi:hypothetical protein